MKVKKYKDPFSSQVHEMAKKFDMATIENKIEDISRLLVEAESLLETHFADKETCLVNFADYPQYSIRIEQLKAAYKTLYGFIFRTDRWRYR